MSKKPEKIVYLSKWVGDYHAPRLIALDNEAKANGMSLSVAQFRNSSNFYSHTQSRRDVLIKELDFTHTPCSSKREEAVATWKYLVTKQPDHIFSLGYNDAISLTSAIYAVLHRKRIYFFSDSKADDQPRKQMGENIKRGILKLFDGALVAGERHADYFKSLGVSGKIEIPYDVIDNEFFNKRSKSYWRLGGGILGKSLPSKYVLCVSRLVPRKRVDLALDVFKKSGIAEQGFKFLLVGDGPERSKLLAHCDAIGISREVIHFDNVPNHRMPAIYGGAVSLILASEYDQWGLCVNEAMACGVPCIVTPRCGVAGEIVVEGNGFIFDTTSVENAAIYLKKLAYDVSFRSAQSKSCLERMKTCGVQDFAMAAMRLVKTPG